MLQSDSNNCFYLFKDKDSDKIDFLFQQYVFIVHFGKNIMCLFGYIRNIKLHVMDKQIRFVYNKPFIYHIIVVQFIVS